MHVKVAQLGKTSFLLCAPELLGYFWVNSECMRNSWLTALENVFIHRTGRDETATVNAGPHLNPDLQGQVRSRLVHVRVRFHQLRIFLIYCFFCFVYLFIFYYFFSFKATLLLWRNGRSAIQGHEDSSELRQSNGSPSSHFEGDFSRVFPFPFSSI